MSRGLTAVLFPTSKWKNHRTFLQAVAARETPTAARKTVAFCRQSSYQGVDRLQTRKMLIGQILNFSMYSKNLQNQKEMGGLDEKSSLHVYVLR